MGDIESGKVVDGKTFDNFGFTIHFVDVIPETCDPQFLVNIREYVQIRFPPFWIVRERLRASNLGMSQRSS